MKSGARGFTLIEILLAILIGSLVLTSVYGIFTSVSRVRNRLGDEGERFHQVRILFDRIGAELGSLRLSPVGNRPVFSSGKDSDGNVFFEFNTELVSPLLLKHGGLSRVRYEIQQDEASEAVVLYRSEQVLLADLAASTPIPFIAGLETFTLRYFGNGIWHDSWSVKTPPDMVEISLEMAIDDKLMPFRSSFILLKRR
ncbi:MAG: prepilin-type N-terminal cleavage/methylation domain-containing protein [Desulfuromonadales bacterium]|nr:prepilin-type N-terminal cleavage/methylation domain-containing protein [Desulfuromonadales bacterium]